MNTYVASYNLLLPYHDTLANLRQRLLMRTGYSQQLSAPPPGISALYNDYLQSSQRQLRNMDGSPFTNELWFTWAMTAGNRFYDLPTSQQAVNALVGDQALPGVVTPTVTAITAQLDPASVKWVGISQGDNVWRELQKGIEPESFRANADAIPYAYEINNGIEVWPAPSDTNWSLRVKGNFDQLPFTADTDVTSIDSELVFLHALATVRGDKGNQSAEQTTLGQMNAYMGNLVARSHGTRRYIPGERVPPPAIPPKMV